MEADDGAPRLSRRAARRKLLPYFVLGLTSIDALRACGGLSFRCPLPGIVAALYALSATFLMPALGQGLLISAATKNQFLASQLRLISAFLPAFLLSGFLFEINSMPTVIQWVTYAVPARYLIPSLQTVFFAGDIWPMFARAITVMFLIGCMFFALAARKHQKRIG